MKDSTRGALARAAELMSSVEMVILESAIIEKGAAARAGLAEHAGGVAELRWRILESVRVSLKEEQLESSLLPSETPKGLR